MKKLSLALLISALFPALVITACASAKPRPEHCATFLESSFDPLDTDHDGYLSDAEFQVHRNQMHGTGVPKDCMIPYDKGSYERLASKKGMNKEEFKMHLLEMDKRANQGMGDAK